MQDFRLGGVFLIEGRQFEQAMKTPFVILFAGLMAAVPLVAQQPAPPKPAPSPTLQAPPPVPKEPAKPEAKFDIDFGGGNPRDLVELIEHITNKPLNVIISDEDNGNVVIPPMKMNQVTVSQLFEAIDAASSRTITIDAGQFSPSGAPPRPFYRQEMVSYGFQMTRMPSDGSQIWVFYDRTPKSSRDRSLSGPSICRFFQLAPYLEVGLKVEDITTAVETAWRMMRSNDIPEVKFHKETSLLIAVGPEDKVALIEQVLRELSVSRDVPLKSDGAAPTKSKPQPAKP